MSWKERYEGFKPGDKVRFVRFTNPFGEELFESESESSGILKIGDILTLTSIYSNEDNSKYQTIWANKENNGVPSGYVYESEIEKVQQ
jgi:hypothetical protein